MINHFVLNTQDFLAIKKEQVKKKCKATLALGAIIPYADLRPLKSKVSEWILEKKY